MGLLKDTSIGSAVAVAEMSFRAKMLVNQTYLSTEIYLLVALFYLAIEPAAIGADASPRTAHGAGARAMSWFASLLAAVGTHAGDAR